MDTQPSWWQSVRHRIGMLINPPDTKKDVSLLYGELLMAVESKFYGETRHETALRYIRAQEHGKERGYALADTGVLCAGDTCQPTRTG